MNYLDYWEIGKGGKEYHCIWITDIALSRETVEPVMRGGRARWKIESAPQAHGKEVQDELTDCA